MPPDHPIAPERPSPRDAITRPAVMLTHPVFATPAFGTNHPLSFERHRALMRLALAQGWLDDTETAQCPLADRATLERFHHPDYLDAFERAARDLSADRATRERYNLGTMECPLFPSLFERASATVGGAMLAADLALEGRIAFHPGGGTHHGRPERASGFCYFNDPVFAILRLFDRGIGRVAYVDLDAHHGDGVENAFAHDPRVTTISIHEAGRWPGTGHLDDRRDGRALNMPVPAGFNDSEFEHLVANVVVPAITAFEPGAIVLTCGADALAGDPLSRLELSNGTLARATSQIGALAPAAVVLGGGGYNPWTLSRGWSVLWAILSGRTPSEPAMPSACDVLRSFSCDLVDDDDRPAWWLNTLLDPPNLGAIRPEITEMARRLAP